MKGQRALALTIGLVLLVAACGRGDDGASSEPPPATEAPPTSAEPEQPDAPEEPDAPVERVTLADGGFGDLGTVCSAGEATPVEGQTGIDGTTINVATFADPGFQGRPGLNQEFFDTAEAVIDWCNENGGVRGYELEVDLRDSALTEYQARVVESCTEDFFMVGGGAVFDDAGQEARLACGLPDVAGFVVTAQAAEADLQVQPVPNPIYSLPTGDLAWLEEQFPGTTENVGVFTGSLPTTLLVADRYTEAIEGLGWNVVYSQSYNPNGEANWKPFAQAMQEAGVEGLIWVGEPENLAKLRQAMVDIDWSPEWVRTDANHYDQNYITIGGDAVADTYVRNAFWPFEAAADNPATADYLELMETYKPDGKFPALLGAQGLSAWMLFLTSLGECADTGDVTRDCVFDAARSHTDWTGGGLHVPMDVAAGTAPPCFSLAEATGDGFVFPDVTEFGSEVVAERYACDPSFVVTLTGDYGEGQQCPSGVENPLPSEC